ncbi:hypothetical protein HY489_03465 [Candidatus Woesearchaeota archaeon]|nr:hypothetical protein [Candidatus Woesearchaeota archaeon]
MKKLMVLLSLLLIACGQTAEQATAPGTSEPKTIGSGKLDIMSAMQQGTPVRCTMEQDGQTVTMYMKGSMMRMDTLPADAHALYTEKKAYMWSGNQGSMIDMDEIKRMSKGQTQQMSQEDIVADAQQKGVSCAQVAVPPGTFDPPADVQFQDLTAALKQMAGMQ